MMGTLVRLGTDARSAWTSVPNSLQQVLFPLNPNDALIHTLRIAGLKLRNLQLNADIILKIYVSIKKWPIGWNKGVFVQGFMYIYQGARREPGWGLRSGLGRGGSVGGGFSADFPTVYMLISNLTALVLELFIHLNANLSYHSLLFFSLSPYLTLSSFVTTTFFLFLETLDCWWKNAN